jgi:hypothetical protein
MRGKGMCTFGRGDWLKAVDPFEGTTEKVIFLEMDGEDALCLTPTPTHIYGVGTLLVFTLDHFDLERLTFDAPANDESWKEVSLFEKKEIFKDLRPDVVHVPPPLKFLPQPVKIPFDTTCAEYSPLRKKIWALAIAGCELSDHRGVLNSWHSWAEESINNFLQSFGWDPEEFYATQAKLSDSI